MHFPIIAIENLETKKADFVKSLNYDDATLNRWCDYYGEPYSEEDRKEVIRSKWLKALFDGIAVINEEDETLTVLDRETVENTIKEYLINLTEDLHYKAEKGELSIFDIRFAAKEYKGYCTLFYVNGYGQTTLEYIEGTQWLAGRTFKIGNVFDAHF